MSVVLGALGQVQPAEGKFSIGIHTALDLDMDFLQVFGTSVALSEVTLLHIHILGCL